MCGKLDSCCFGVSNLRNGCKCVAIFMILSSSIHLGTLYYDFQWRTLILSLLEIAINLCLLYGVNVKKTFFSIVWLVAYALKNIIYVFLMALLTYIIFFEDPDKLREMLIRFGFDPDLVTEAFMRAVLIGALVIFGLMTALNIYCWMVVFSYKNEVQRQQRKLGKSTEYFKYGNFKDVNSWIHEEKQRDIP